jgi:hypothetical protein
VQPDFIDGEVMTKGEVIAALTQATGQAVPLDLHFLPHREAVDILRHIERD